MKKRIILTFILFNSFCVFTFAQKTWTGDTNNMWDNSGNWNSNTVPTSADNVIIPDCSSLANIPEKSGSDMDCNNLTIEAGGKLTIYKKILHVHGNLIIESPNNENPSGSLIEAGKNNDKIIVDGTVTIQRYYSVNGRYQYISSPLKNVSGDLFTSASISGNFNPNFYSYNESYNCIPNPSSSTPTGKYEQWANTDLVNAWEEYHNGEGNPGKNLDVGQGYAFYNDADVTINYTGSTDSVINHGNINVPVTNTKNDENNGYYDGWNLIGNPYPSAYNFFENRNPGNVDSTIYLWNGTNYVYYNYSDNTDDNSVSSYVVNGGDNTYKNIPAGQAFFVKAASSGGSFKFYQTKRTHSEQTLTKKNANHKIDFIKLKITDNDFSDETVIRFTKNATVDYDGAFDAYKLFISDMSVPQIFSYTENTLEPLAINTLPKSNTYYEIPLIIRIKDEGYHNIYLSDSYLQNYNAYLKDNRENEIIDLKQIQSYNFFHEGGFADDRFTILIQGIQTNINDKIYKTVKIYPNPASDFIFAESNNNINNIEIFDINGKMILSKNSFSRTKEKINLSEIKQGIYIIKIYTTTNTVVKKLSINN